MTQIRTRHTWVRDLIAPSQVWLMTRCVNFNKQRCTYRQHNQLSTKVYFWHLTHEVILKLQPPFHSEKRRETQTNKLFNKIYHTGRSYARADFLWTLHSPVDIHDLLFYAVKRKIMCMRTEKICLQSWKSNAFPRFCFFFWDDSLSDCGNTLFF